MQLYVYTVWCAGRQDMIVMYIAISLADVQISQK